MGTNLTIAKGENSTVNLQVSDDTGAAVNITGSTITLTVKDDTDESAVRLQKVSTNPSEITITDAVGGLAEVYFVPADTVAIIADTYAYDIWIELAGGEQFQIIPVSHFKILERITVL